MFHRLLNKVTSDSFIELSKRIIAVNVDSPETLNVIVQLVNIYCTIYAVFRFFRKQPMNQISLTFIQKFVWFFVRELETLNPRILTRLVIIHLLFRCLDI